MNMTFQRLKYKTHSFTLTAMLEDEKKKKQYLGQRKPHDDCKSEYI